MGQDPSRTEPDRAGQAELTARPMSLLETLTLFAAAAGVFALAVWRSSRPSDPLRPRLIPWTMVMLIAVTVMLVALVHVLAIYGIDLSDMRRR